MVSRQGSVWMISSADRRFGTPSARSSRGGNGVQVTCSGACCFLLLDAVVIATDSRGGTARLIRDIAEVAHAERCRFQRADWWNSSAAALAAGSIKPGSS
jgi:hypothetical protein